MSKTTDYLISFNELYGNPTGYPMYPEFRPSSPKETGGDSRFAPPPASPVAGSASRTQQETTPSVASLPQSDIEEGEGQTGEGE
jgi:hypothetical protein